MSEEIQLEDTGRFDPLYWSYNLPLQMWPIHADHNDESSPLVGWRILNYMPRKERCINLDNMITSEEAPAFCRNAAKILRNLANRFDALADGKIELIYYPDDTTGISHM